jgi:hypothetical protein
MLDASARRSQSLSGTLARAAGSIGAGAINGGRQMPKDDKPNGMAGKRGAAPVKKKAAKKKTAKKTAKKR